MSTLKVLSEISLFDDSDTSNNPTQVRIDYKLNLEEELGVDVRMDTEFPNSATTAITLPSGTFNWLYVLSDQSINIRLNSVGTDEVNVSPSEAGTKDGLLIKRGNFTAISINVPGTTDAKVSILAGKI